MKDGRILKTGQGEFEAATYAGHNASGYAPVNDKVLVLVDLAAAKTKGGIILTDDSVEKQTWAAETGVIIDVGPSAFAWNADRTLRWDGEKPRAGDRVYIERYSGQLLTGADGKLYRLLDDKCVGAVEIRAASKRAA